MYDGNHCDSLDVENHRNGGFLYGDALMAATIVLIILPTILYIFSSATQRLQESYHKDQVQQDVVAFIEEGKAKYDTGQLPTLGVAASHFSYRMEDTEYILSLSNEVVHTIPIIRYTVEAKEGGHSIYELSTYLGSPLE